MLFVSGAYLFTNPIGYLIKHTQEKIAIFEKNLEATEMELPK